MPNVNDAHTTTINLEHNKAYRVIEKKDAIVLKENDAYETAAVTAIPLADNEAYRVIERKDAIVTRKNDAYEAGAILSVKETVVDNQNIIYYDTIT